jgi:hypothetical protein
LPRAVTLWRWGSDILSWNCGGGLTRKKERLQSGDLEPALMEARVARDCSCVVAKTRSGPERVERARMRLAASCTSAPTRIVGSRPVARQNGVVIINSNE